MSISQQAISGREKPSTSNDTGSRHFSDGLPKPGDASFVEADVSVDLSEEVIRLSTLHGGTAEYDEIREAPGGEATAARTLVSLAADGDRRMDAIDIADMARAVPDGGSEDGSPLP